MPLGRSSPDERDRTAENADRLRTLGIGPGDRVGVRVASGTAELYVAILGILSSGAAYVPVDAEDPSIRATDLFRRAGMPARVPS
jgi:non-ribosomal peptide synthetase component F